MARENYYLLLGLDPTAPGWDDWAGVLEPALRKKWREACQESNHPTRKNEFKQLRDSVKDIECVLKEPETRRQEAEEAKTELHKRQAAALAELNEAIQVTAAKGYLTDDDIKVLGRRGAGRWEEADVRGRAAKFKIRVQAASSRPSTPKPRLDESIDNRIRKNLELVGKNSLYDFLGAVQSATTKSLRDLANQLYTTIHQVSVKSAEVTAQGELVGECLRIFGSDAGREKYDNTVEWRELEAIRGKAELAGDGEGCIRAAVTQELIKRGRKQKIDPDAVVAAVVEVAARRKWTVEVPSAAAAVAWRRCGRCGELSADGASTCGDCGSPFQVACPKCGNLNSSSARFCTTTGCGFAIGDMPFASRAVRSARAALSSDLAQAKALLTEALGYWPDYAEATQLLGEVRRQEKELRQDVEAVEGAIADRQFEAASKAVEAFARKYPKHAELGKYQKRVRDALDEAARQVAKARALDRQGRTDEAVDAFCEALRTCADCRDAREALANSPPSAVPLLQASPGPTSITLTWKSSPSRGQIAYRLLRKAGSQPTNAADGELLGQPTASPFSDATAKPGTLYYYAAFADRGGVVAHRAAVAGPVVRTADIAHLKARAGDRTVTLEWHPPAGAGSVEVWRTPLSEPRHRGDGVRVPATLTSAIDSGLTNDTAYGYRVVAVFRGPDGHPLYAGGIASLVVPMTPPPPVIGLAVARRGQHFEVKWPQPVSGQVRLFALDGSPSRSCGDIVPLADLDEFGRAVPLTGSASARLPFDPQADLHILPVTVNGSVAVIGRAVAISGVDDVTRLAAEARGGQLFARWDWPHGIDVAQVCIRTDRFPTGPEDPQAMRKHCIRRQYGLDGGFRQPLPRAARVFVAVFAAVNRAGGWHYASGTADCRQEVAVLAARTVRYRVEVCRQWMILSTGEYELLVAPDAATTLPELMLLFRPDGLPLHPEDGVVVARTETGAQARPDRPLCVRFRPPQNFVPRNTKLFPSDAADAGWLELLEVL